MEGTRDQLRRRPDVADDDIDDIVGIAAELQEAASDRVSVEAVEKVAQELDVDAKYVEQAIAELGRRRQVAAADQATSDAARAARNQRVRSVTLLVLAAVAGLLVLIAVGLGGMATLSSSALRAADAEVARTEAALDTVLVRQERLVPQLVALAGGGAPTFPDVPDDGAMDARLAASSALSQALTTQLATLPPVSDAASGQIRLNLQHELAGAENRISVERGRWVEAVAEQHRLEATLGGRVARSVFW